MNDPYFLLQIGVLTLVLYLLSFVLARLDIISRVVHRKIWNAALILAFLVTAILGILLAIQINYKLEWPIVKTLLKWHVNFGIALTFIGTFHLLWHRKYYYHIFKPAGDHPAEKVLTETASPLKLNHLNLLILLSGFLSTVIQVLFIREITTVFEGNELMMGWTLGTWMLLTGTGAFLGRSKKNPEKASGMLDTAFILLACLPLIMVPLLDILKTNIFPPGVMVNPVHFLLILLIFLAPVCLISGYIYSMLVKTLSSSGGDFSRVYALEAVGSLIGGAVVSFVFVQWLSVIQSLIVLACVSGIVFAVIHHKIGYYIAVAIALAILLFVSGGLNNTLKSFLFIHQKVVDSKETFYGNITITENAGQYNFYGNGSLLYTTDNIAINEEFTHYVLLQHRQPEEVLLVSGGIGGMVAEILKYSSVKEVDYVELNPRLISMAGKYKPLPADKRVHILFDDGRRYIQHIGKKYDVVIFAVPDPSSLQINRFYTDEFITLLKHKLNPGAMILYGVSASGNYMSAEKIGIESTVYQTLKNNFQHVEIIPGERDYFIASDSALRTDVAKLSASRKIETQYVNSYYIDDLTSQQRGAFIKANLVGGNKLDLDEKPLPVFYHTLQFISEYTTRGWTLMVIPVILLLLPLFVMRPVAAGMYITGLTASSFEILIIFTFQTYYGYVYSAIGIIIAIFMGGLALGSVCANRFSITRNHFVAGQVLLVLYALFFPVFWFLQKGISNDLTGLLLFFLITVLLSAITGFQYVAGTRLLPGSFTRTAPLLYAVDLIGSSLGAIAISVILLPLMGVINSCLLVAGFNLLLAIINSLREN
ncbi:MAG: fused MFS/spermidine synthase [Bacteroidota bacterium]|nr:fused MFS/spermidine synthase [Bacteroidota bacterium]